MTERTPGSNTAMTMPVKIWVDETSEDEEGFVLGRFDYEYVNVDQPYIRADIAEELARALFNMCLGIEQDGELPYDAAQSALTRYREAGK